MILLFSESTKAAFFQNDGIGNIEEPESALSIPSNTQAGKCRNFHLN